MAYKTKNTYKNESHPWEPYIPEKANKLILGTFPTSERNRGSYEFFYPNPNNEFWKILFAVAGQNLADYSKKDPVEIRKQVMKKLQLGIADMGKTIFRQRGNSSDVNLFPIEFTDVFQLLDKHKKITTIIVGGSDYQAAVMGYIFERCFLVNGFNTGIERIFPELNVFYPGRQKPPGVVRCNKMRRGIEYYRDVGM